MHRFQGNICIEWNGDQRNSGGNVEGITWINTIIA